ncbi:MAG: tetraacyldisaccharide 4'-kinase [Phycisphaeraceae bacterium]
MSQSDPTNLHAMMSGLDRSSRAALFRSAAGAAEPVYDLVVRCRNAMFDRGWRKQHRAHVPVVSVGNITTGGTGKTPMVMEVVSRLQKLGATPAVLTRGYKADSEGFSDEAMLMKLKLPGVPVIVNGDRVAGAKAMGMRFVAPKKPEAALAPGTDSFCPGLPVTQEEKLPGAGVNVIVLDDGFQHRRIARDIDIVLVDATCPFGYDHLLPRGLLREPPEVLKRASAVIVTKCDAGDAALDERIARYHGKLPLGHVSHRWAAVVDERDQPVRAETSRRVIAFAGIGRPDAFFTEAGKRLNVVETIALADHMVYDDATLQRLREAGKRLNPDAFVTTEKDWVKLRQWIQSSPMDQPIWRAVLELQWRDGDEALNALLRQVVR